MKLMELYAFEYEIFVSSFWQTNLQKKYVISGDDDNSFFIHEYFSLSSLLLKSQSRW